MQASIYHLTVKTRNSDVEIYTGRRVCGVVKMFLISNFRRVLNAICFLLGSSPASKFYLPTFRNTLPVPSS